MVLQCSFQRAGMMGALDLGQHTDARIGFRGRPGTGTELFWFSISPVKWESKDDKFYFWYITGKSTTQDSSEPVLKWDCQKSKIIMFYKGMLICYWILSQSWFPGFAGTCIWWGGFYKVKRARWKMTIKCNLCWY